MSMTEVPWLEAGLLLAVLGAVWSAVARPVAAVGVAVCAAVLVCGLAEWYLNHAGLVREPGPRVLPGLAVDSFSAPLLPLVALLHLLTALSSSRTETTRGYLFGLLASLALQTAKFGCKEPWLLIGLLAVGMLRPWAELVALKKSGRLFALHMLLFVGLLAGGWACVTQGHREIGGVLLTVGVLVRCGIVPLHSWVVDLFEKGPISTAVLFVGPLVGMYAAVRLVMPIAPEWVLRALAGLALFTAVYAAGLAVVQRESRRFFAYLFLSHRSLVLVGLALVTPVSLTGALALWIGLALSLTGLALTLRALEGRFGRLSLTEHHGLYPQSPMLAVCFMLMALASVGFPGTLGLISTEMLVDGAITAVPLVGLAVILVGALNGIAVMRAYFLLFTGAHRTTSVPLGITPGERMAVLVMSLLILGGGLFPQPGIASRYRAAKELLASRGVKAPADPGRPR